MGVLGGRAALLTGAATGIGRATAILFAREGASVVIADINTSGGHKTAAEITESGGRAWFQEADVASTADVGRLVEKSSDLMGGLDLVVNNAGVMRAALVADFEEADWDLTMAVNVKSIFLTTRAAHSHLKRSGKGVILNTASTAAYRGGPGIAAYSASKGAVVAFTKVLAKELAPDRIRVNCVCPGYIDTPFNKPAIDFIGGMDQQEATVRQVVPMKRQGSPEDVAGAFLYLASDAASYVTGQALNIDGGFM
jgi:NAD(P)-dependent dehydrogenase (short-subunit alcohol dehydrogenase family)